MQTGELIVPKLEALNSHADHFQIDGFKKALSRGGGANKFLKFLSRKKDGTGTANADTITLDDMLTFSPVRPSHLPVIANHTATWQVHAHIRRA